MSNASREAYLKWRQGMEIYVSGSTVMTPGFIWDAAWQAAQAQAGDGEAVGKVYYTGRGFLDVDWFTSDIPDDALLYAAPPAAVNQQLTLGDLNTIRQWHNAIKDAYVNYLEEQDAAVFAKIKAAIAAAQEQNNSATAQENNK